MFDEPSDRKLHKYKAEIAEWETVRAKGFVRFILIRGVLLRGVPLAVVFSIIAYLIRFGFQINAEYLSDPWNLLFSGVIGFYFGLKGGAGEWGKNENEYNSWKTYESGGNILGINN